jgi:hypothetical protein
MGFLPVLIQRNFNAAGLGGVATNVGLGAEGWAEGLKKRPGTIIVAVRVVFELDVVAIHRLCR